MYYVVLNEMKKFEIDEMELLWILNKRALALFNHYAKVTLAFAERETVMAINPASVLQTTLMDMTSVQIVTAFSLSSR